MKNNQTKFYWQKILGIFAIVSAASTISTAAIANPHNSTELYLAQVGVRSRINSPTPINLRPRHHIPLPSSNRSSRYNRRYNQHRDYRYSEYNDDYYRDRRINRKYRRRHQSDYDRDIHNQRSRKRRTRGSITVFF